MFLSSAWIKVEQLKPYHAHKEEMIKINKGKRFQQAVDSVEDYLKKAKGKEQVRLSPLLHSENNIGNVFKKQPHTKNLIAQLPL